MGANTIRVIGDPALPVSIVYESWGNCSAFPGINFLNSEADVLVIGETQDWDLIAYAQDLVASGRKKALIVLGHVKSEQWGMKACAEWLGGFVKEVPVEVRADHRALLERAPPRVRDRYEDLRRHDSSHRPTRRPCPPPAPHRAGDGAAAGRPHHRQIRRAGPAADGRPDRRGRSRPPP